MSGHVIVRLVETPPATLAEYVARIDGEGNEFDGQEHVEAAYNAYRQRHQPWRWVALSAGNHEPLAKSTESYFNRADCEHAIEVLFSATTRVELSRTVDGIESRSPLR